MEDQKSLRIVFMGSPDFGVPVLERLHKNYQIKGVVTQPDRPAGRGRKLQPPAIKSRALELNLPVIQPDRIKNHESMQQLYDWDPDLIVVAAYGQILKTELLQLPKSGCINVHASLLPRWRGAAPIQAAILHGDFQTGITIMRMDEGMDTGPVLNQRSIPIAPDETGGSLYESLSKLGAELLIETLPGYLSGSIKLKKQEDSLATYAPMLKKKDGELDLTKPALELERQVRAFNPWPGTFIEWKDIYLKIHQVRLAELHANEMMGNQIPGPRRIIQGYPAVMTGSGALVLERVQPPGKKIMSGKDFLSGSRDWISNPRI